MPASPCRPILPGTPCGDEWLILLSNTTHLKTSPIIYLHPPTRAYHWPNCSSRSLWPDESRLSLFTDWPSLSQVTLMTFATLESVQKGMYAKTPGLRVTKIKADRWQEFRFGKRPRFRVTKQCGTFDSVIHWFVYLGHGWFSWGHGH